MIGGMELGSDGRMLPDAALAGAAHAGDVDAWNALVDRHAQMVWTMACREGLDERQAAEVSRLTWLRCLDHLDELTLGGARDWLSTTAAIEAARVRRSNAVHRSAIDGEAATA